MEPFPDLTGIAVGTGREQELGAALISLTEIFPDPPVTLRAGGKQKSKPLMAGNEKIAINGILVPRPFSPPPN